MKLPQLFESHRFKKSFCKLGPGLDIQSRGAVHDLVNRYISNPNNFLSNYDRVENIKRRIVIEIDVSGANRMLADVEGDRVTLLDVGGHELVRRYPRKSLLDDIKSAVRARAGFWPADNDSIKFFREAREKKYKKFANEVDPEWLYYLSDQQNGIAESIRRQTARAHADEPRFFIIMGGPGTGKTSILLKLLIDLRDVKNTKPVLAISNEVAEHIQSCLPKIDFSGCFINNVESVYRINDIDEKFNVLLFDDPMTKQNIEFVLNAAQNKFKVAVIAFDPYQLSTDLTDSEYELLLGRCNVRQKYVLTKCYRQKENVGKAALAVMENIAASTPFLDSNKIASFQENHSMLTKIANRLDFLNPYGYVSSYEVASVEDVIYEVDRLKKLPLWKHTPPVLIVMDEKSKGMGWHWEKLLRGVKFRSITIRTEDYSELERIKGIEYQHVFIVINEELYTQIKNGFVGTGQREYHRRRLLRIPWSRGKDSLVVFITSD